MLILEICQEKRRQAASCAKRSAAGDGSNRDGCGCKDGSDDDSGHGVFSFHRFLPCSAGGDQSDHDGCGGDDDGSNDEFHGFFSSLFFGQRVAIRVTMTAADAKMEVTMIAVMI